MKLETLKMLPLIDQLTMLRGRILEESLSMEAVARYVHVRLNGGSALEDALHTPQQYQTLIRECAVCVRSNGLLNAEPQRLAIEAVEESAALYERRNRFVHDALRRSLLSEDAWGRVKLWRKKGERGEPLPEAEPVSADEMIDLVLALVRATWRLRGVLWTLLSASGEVSPYLTQVFEPQWDGSFLATSRAPDDSPSTLHS